MIYICKSCGEIVYDSFLICVHCGCPINKKNIEPLKTSKNRCMDYIIKDFEE